ncbi:hypothetical protein Rhopal_002431-T1 [Rhodotorula paludigena]|uniref:SET domain-containing protein n=1 Tax=Rhodotorula paludigena TaxID=86838 RepID=A0AAV5GIY4_9BASI|nr:hypothetical protein Rhopal_002431-T1 [Rhodotorula paludigena]
MARRFWAARANLRAAALLRFAPRCRSRFIDGGRLGTSTILKTEAEDLTKPTTWTAPTEKPPLVLKADLTTTDERHDLVKLERLEARIKQFKLEQRLAPSWTRQIAGPSYDIKEEFSTEIQDAVNKRERAWRKSRPTEHPLRDAYKGLFEQMVFEASLQEYPPSLPDFRPKIRIVPPVDLPPQYWSSPPFEFTYTNRVVYSDGIVPKQAPGCSCKGNCGSPDNRFKCECRNRQIQASRTRPNGGPRSNHDDFAYDDQERLNSDVLLRQDPIIECNSQCGCGTECQNRVVGLRQGISVDIFYTGLNGWGVRLPERYTNDPINGSYSPQIVRRGELLAIYAGELLRSPDAHARDDLVYCHVKRNYIYDLDSWTTEKIAVAPPDSAHKTVSSAGQRKRKKPRGPSMTPEVDQTAFADDSFTSLYSIDAFSMGNWTRFANHVCEGSNAVPRPVYVDEGDVSRPLWVFFARKDIYPGDEITISYAGEVDPNPADYGLTRAQYIERANRSREEAPPHHRCYCGKRLCRGRMFVVDGEMLWDKLVEDGTAM